MRGMNLFFCMFFCIENAIFYKVVKIGSIFAWGHFCKSHCMGVKAEEIYGGLKLPLLYGGIENAIF